MMSDWGNGVSTQNSFDPLCSDPDFQTVKRKRNNTGHSEERQLGTFFSSSIDQKLNLIYDEMRGMREGQEKMNRGMLHFEQSIRCVNNKLDEVIDVTNRNSNVLRTLAYKSIDLEARSRRNNLLFWGLSENYNENCFSVIREFIKHQLGLDADNMYLARAHRLGPRRVGQRNPKRPIIVNFRDYCDTNIIMNHANRLRNTPFSIGYDLPKEIKEARKRLWEEVKRIKRTSPDVKFQILYPAKLLVGGKIVIDEFPDWGRVMQGSRMADFTHIDKTALFENEQRDHSNLHNGSMLQMSEQIPATQVVNLINGNASMNGHSNSVARDTFDTLSSGPHNDTSQLEITVHTEEDSNVLQSNGLPGEQMETAAPRPTKSSEAASLGIFRPYENKTERLLRSTQCGLQRTASLSVPRDIRGSSADQQKKTVKNNTPHSQDRHESMSPLRNVNTNTNGDDSKGASGENNEGASRQNDNTENFDTKS